MSKKPEPERREQQGDSASGVDGSEMRGLVAAAAMLAAGDRSAARASDGNRPSALGGASSTASGPPPGARTPGEGSEGGKGPAPSPHAKIGAARARRLEQNRRAAVESRRRKKVMIEELRRSANFYAKANETLRTDNLDLERRLFAAREAARGAAREAARRRLLAVEGATGYEGAKDATAGAGVAAEGGTKPASCGAGAARPSRTGSDDRDGRPPAAAAAEAVPFPTSNPSASPAGHPCAAPIASDVAMSQQTALSQQTRYLDNAPVAIAASIANLPNLDAKPGALEPTGAPMGRQIGAHLQPIPLPSEEEVGSDRYIASLEKFVMHQTAAANAAAAAANAALRAIELHRIMKGKSQQYRPTGGALAALSAASLPTSTAAKPSEPSPARSASEGEGPPSPPSKRRKS